MLMMPRTLLAIVAALAACSTAAGLFAAADSTYAKNVAQWRAKHEADYTRDWVSVAGLFFLKPGGNRAGSASSNAIVLSPAVPASIGSFVLDGKRVRFEPQPGVAVTLRGQPVSKPI